MKLVDNNAGKYAVYDRLGFSLLLDGSSLVDRSVIETGTWEPEQLRTIQAYMEHFRGKSGSTFMDVGAYWGLYSLLAMRSGAFVDQYAIEADSHNHGQLQSNLFMNEALRDIKVINKAVSDHSGEMKFRDSRFHSDGNRAGSGLLPPDSELKSYTVECMKIDDLGISGRHILIKVDVEGHEHAVLRGMADTIKNNRILMQIEIFDEQKDAVFYEVNKLGLRVLQSIKPDYYMTNMSDLEIIS